MTNFIAFIIVVLFMFALGAATGLFLSWVLSLFGIIVVWWKCWVALIALGIVGRTLFWQKS